ERCDSTKKGTARTLTGNNDARGANLEDDARLNPTILRIGGVVIDAHILLAQRIDMLVRALFGDLFDLAAYFYPALSVIRINGEYRHHGAFFHILHFLTTTRTIDADISTVIVCPDRRDLRLSITVDRRQTDDNRAFE